MPEPSSQPAATPTPIVRDISPLSPLTWLAKGWSDMRRAGFVSVAHGFLASGFGLLLFAIARDHFWLLAGAFSGFLLVAPVFATGLYALSRALERGESADFDLLIRTWTRWGTRRRADPSSYWCLVRFGALLALAGTGWVLNSVAFITAMSPAPINSPADFIQHVVLAPDGWVFEIWLVLGGLLAAPVFASSVVSIPLLLDRHVRAHVATLTSIRAVQTNPVTMAVWASLLMLLTFVGMATAMLGLIVLVPLMGHASWHAYRDLVDARHIDERLPAGASDAHGASR